MQSSDIESIGKSALKLALAKSKIKGAAVLGVEQLMLGDARVYRCHVGTGEANDPAKAVVVDEGGKEVEAAYGEGAAALTSVHAATGFAAAVPVATAPITIDPAENILTLNPGDSHTETITVKVPKSSATAKADVYFLADTTGSMGSILAAVKTGANTILSSLLALGVDFHFGVGNYRDFPNEPFAFQHQQSLTNIPAAVTTAINAWTAAGGGDSPEGQFFALDKLAEPPGGGIGWRAGSKRIIVMFGDNPSHDPICPAISGQPAPITEASVTAKLTSQAITVLAISVLSPGLDADPKAGATDYTAACGAPGGLPGQGTRIATATGGQFVGGINAGNIVSTIISLVTAAVSTINNLKLVASGATAPFVESITPPGGYGPLAGDKEHELKFVVVFRGQPCKETEQVYTGTLDVVADGKVVAQKRVRITVPPCAAEFVYSVKFVCGVQPDCPCECAPTRPGSYATDINIHNFSNVEVRLEKAVIPVVFQGAAAGREPGFATPKAFDKIVLPPHSATMDDCCRIAELLLGAKPAAPMPLTIGFLEITSSRELAVTAVYTVSDVASRSISIDVEQVQPARAKRG